MLKNGAAPNKLRILYCFLPIEFHSLNSRIDFSLLLPFGELYYLNFLRDGMGSFYKYLYCNISTVETDPIRSPRNFHGEMVVSSNEISTDLSN